jgi:tetratricopeptide (TPR) repeat protein
MNQPRYQPGDKIGGRYQVHQVKMGGMGEVYLCLDLEQNYPYALKTFQQRYLGDPRKLRAAFEQEVVTWVALEKHPNIVRCFLMDILDNQPFMVLEWIAGEEGKGTDLRGWLRRGPLDLRLTLDFTIDICRGLIHAQEKQRGLVHRDLKPENVLVAQGPLAKITDFGLAQIVETAGLENAEAGAESEGRQPTVGRGGVAGTPAYTAPEQWRGESLDARTDIYAVGCILYEMLTGSWPFQATTLDGLRRQHLEGKIPKVSERNPLLGELDTLLGDCLAKQREERLSSVDELSQQLAFIYQRRFAEPPRAAPALEQFRASDYNNRAATYDNLRHYDEALRDYGRAIELNPNYTLAYFNRGNTYAELQCYDEALRDYGRAIRLDRDYAPAYCNRGNTYDALQCCDEAFQDYGRAIDLDPNFVQAYYNRGNTYRKLQQYQAALRDYGQVIELEPTYAQAYSNRGLTYHELQQYDEALWDYGRAIDLDPNDASAYVNRGNTYDELQQYDAALTDYGQAIELDPTYAQAYSNRGATNHRLERYDKALGDYNRAIQMDSTYVQAYYNRGATYATLQRYAEALRDFSRAIQLDRNYAKAYYYRGNTYLSLQRYDEALRDYNRAIELEPTVAAAYSSRGLTRAALQQYEAALDDYGRAIKLDPNDALAYYNRGLTYAELRQYEAALADFRWAIELDPNFAQAYVGRGTTYAALQQYEVALCDYERAIELDPNNARAYSNLGALLGHHGKLLEALSYFETGAQLGDPLGAQNAAQVRQVLGTDAAPQVDLARLAFEAFQQADTMVVMQQAVARFPLMAEADFIAALEQAFAQRVPPEHRPAFEQRLAWLRQIADEQKRRNDQ